MTATILATERHFQHVDYVVLAGYLAVLEALGNLLTFAD